MVFNLKTLFLLQLTIMGQQASDITVNHEKIVLKKGDEITLKCTSDSETLGCSFKSPAEHNYNMLRGAAFEEGRIHQKELDPKDCAMKITNIIQADDGNWNCNVTSKLSNGEYDIGTAKIQVIVATPPVEVYMKIEEKLITGPIIMNLEENNQTFVKCIATGANPAPEFKWYIADKPVNGNINNTKEEVEDGKINFISIFEYIGDPKDIGQMLKCEAVHKGYEKQQLEAWNNIAKAQLNLQFKPWVEICVFNEAKIGQLGIVTCMFRSNPKPTEGQWNMETITIPIGGEDDGFKSSQISDGGMEGEYTVNLNFTVKQEILGKNYTFEVKNSLGTTIYQFYLEISTEPPTVPPTEPPTRPPTGPVTRPVTGTVTGPPAGPPSDPPTKPPTEPPSLRIGLLNFNPNLNPDSNLGSSPDSSQDSNQDSNQDSKPDSNKDFNVLPIQGKSSLLTSNVIVIILVALGTLGFLFNAQNFL